MMCAVTVLRAIDCHCVPVIVVYGNDMIGSDVINSTCLWAPH